MKAVFVFAIGLLASNAFAAQGTCPVPGDASDRVEKIVAAIKATQECNAAADLASDCSYGASADAEIAGTAADLCGSTMEKNGAKIENRNLLTKMYNACNAQWSGRSGTLYISINAFCQLEAVKWMANLTSGNND